MGFTWCDKLPDEADKYLAEKRQRLQNASLAGCGKLTNEAERCRSVQSVSLGGCRELTAEAAKRLAEKCKGRQA